MSSPCSTWRKPHGYHTALCHSDSTSAFRTCIYSIPVSIPIPELAPKLGRPNSHNVVTPLSLLDDPLARRTLLPSHHAPQSLEGFLSYLSFTSNNRAPHSRDAAAGPKVKLVVAQHACLCVTLPALGRASQASATAVAASPQRRGNECAALGIPAVELVRRVEFRQLLAIAGNAGGDAGNSAKHSQVDPLATLDGPEGVGPHRHAEVGEET